ncbi:SDR family oxidoreductase [Cryobacterium sp. TMT1-3]|uniref:SDR family oxidoreductase n=1 Tax=Cryobacterium luteum TaxID=1424661 RepID=A0A1H8CUK3_9MICO|nr:MULTISPECIES: SDR family oxidoreductase [Cryobacterium]TFB91790.1 SDR family oxidoreductase [Cryobacterium luteum]TFC31237.1 SDR family oxidoreductase [Cryobacterium sp. TMT1-3]SEM98666.1 Putative NADH-flavin reductase [Cryobacterium luteum]
MTKIAIIGGHGKVALHLARLLTADGHDVSSLIRNPAHADDVAATGATPMLADIENLSTDELATILTGQDALVWSAGAGGGSAERTYAVDRDAAIRSMNAAAQAGIYRYVMVSYLGSRADHGASPDDGMFAYYEAKAAADDYLRATSLNWTILGPSTLTLNPATGTINVGSDLPRADTSRENVARVAAAVLANENTAGRFIEFTDGDVPIDEAVAAVR